MQKITRKHLDVFLRAHATEAKVLDIGSGGSSYDRYFPNRITVDIDPARNPEVVADAAHLPFPDSSFETILSTEMLEHVSDPRTVLQELFRVLAPGGTLILTTRFMYPLHDAPGDYWRFTRPALEMLFADFGEVKIQAEAQTFSTVAIILQRIAFQTSVRGGRITKALLLCLAKIMESCDFLIIKSFGDIKKSVEVPESFTSGYYVVGKKYYE